MCRNCPGGGGNFEDVYNAIISLFAITLGFYEGDFRDLQDDPVLLAVVLVFVTFSSILLLNLLIAQLNKSYEYIYKDVDGYARLSRASLIVEAMKACTGARWTQFVQSLELDERVEFDKGDLGLSGCMQVLEPSKNHTCTSETIRRFGGSTAQELPWPEDLATRNKDDDRIEKIEQMLQEAGRPKAQAAAATTGRPAGGAGPGTVFDRVRSGGDTRSEGGSHSEGGDEDD